MSKDIKIDYHELATIIYETTMKSTNPRRQVFRIKEMLKAVAR